MLCFWVEYIQIANIKEMDDGSNPCGSRYIEIDDEKDKDKALVKAVRIVEDELRKRGYDHRDFRYHVRLDLDTDAE